jgi:hypothetical protein
MQQPEYRVMRGEGQAIQGSQAFVKFYLAVGFEGEYISKVAGVSLELARRFTPADLKSAASSSFATPPFNARKSIMLITSRQRLNHIN